MPRIGGIGLTLGLVGAFSIRTLLQGHLYGIGAMDPLVIGSVGAVLGLAAVAACAIPARRAARIDPLAALQN